MNVNEAVNAARYAADEQLADERERGYASSAEFWAEAKAGVELLKKQCDAIKKLHEEMWDSVKDRDDDSALVVVAELGRAADELVRRGLRLCAMTDMYQRADMLLAKEAGDDDSADD